MHFIDLMKKRRSRYMLSSNSTISDERLSELLKEVIVNSPTAFNSQSARVMLLLKEKHDKLWSIVLETLRKIVPEKAFANTEAKIKTFASAYGTVLFFEDMEKVEELQSAFPTYSENFPVWSNESSGMLQFAVWTALSAEGLGASLQHYNPLIDAEVKKEFYAGEKWRLVAQMPFGTPTGEPGEVDRKPINERFFVLGG